MFTIRMLAPLTALALAAVACGGSNAPAEDTQNGAAAETVGGQPATCTSEEITYFSCETDAGKLIAICGGGSIETNDAYVQYRFGTRSKTEQQLPPSSVRTDYKNQTSFYMSADADTGGVIFWNTDSTKYEVNTKAADNISGYETAVLIEDRLGHTIPGPKCNIHSTNGVDFAPLSTLYNGVL